MSATAAYTYVEKEGIFVTITGDFSTISEVLYKEVSSSTNGIFGQNLWRVAELTHRDNSTITFRANLVSNNLSVRLYNGSTIVQEFTVFIMELEEFKETIENTVETAGETGEVKKYYLAVSTAGFYSGMFMVWRDIYDVKQDDGTQLPLQGKIVDSNTGEVVGLVTGYITTNGRLNLSQYPTNIRSSTYNTGLQVYKHFMSIKEYVQGRKYLFVYTVGGTTEVDEIIYDGNWFVDTLPLDQQWRRIGANI